MCVVIEKEVYIILRRYRGIKEGNMDGFDLKVIIVFTITPSS